MRLRKSYKHGVVYAICDANGRGVYIGATRTTPRARFKFHRAHARAGRTAPVARWLRENMDQATIRVLVDQVPVAHLDETECRFIDAFRASGAHLLNVQVTYYDKSPDDGSAGR